MDNFVKALIKEPNKLLTHILAYNRLKTFQRLVGGRIESINISGITNGDTITCYGYDEAKLENQKANFALILDGYAVDCVVGTVVFVGHDGNGNNRSLTDVEIKIIKDRIPFLEEVKEKFYKDIDDWSDYLCCDVYESKEEWWNVNVANGRFKKIMSEET